MENVAVYVRKKITMDKCFSQVKIVTPNNISKILQTSVRSVISSVDIVNNFLMVSGKIVANAVYLTDENKIENTETTIDFVEKQKIGFIISELVAEDDLEINNINCSSSEVIISVSHKIDVSGVYRYLLGDVAKADADLVLNKKNLEVMSFKSAGDENFVVAEEIDTNLKDIKILNVDSVAVLNSYICGVDKVVLDGKVRVNALYSDDSGLGEISKEFEFKQEMPVKNALPGMGVEIVLRHLNTAVVEQNKDDKNKLAFVIDLAAKAYVLENTNLLTFDDLFSLKNEIIPVYEIADFEECDGCDFDTDTVLTQTNVSSLQDFDDVVGVYQPSVSVIDYSELENKIQIKAEIHALVVYKTETSIEKLDLVYETKFETEKENTKQLCKVSAIAAVSAFKVKAGKDLECAFSVEYKFEYKKEKSEKFVKSFEIEKEKNNLDAGVKVYVTRENQTVFEVAKALNVRPELITSQMEVGDCFEAGQKVFVYCPLNFV